MVYRGDATHLPAVSDVATVNGQGVALDPDDPEGVQLPEDGHRVVLPQAETRRRQLPGQVPLLPLHTRAAGATSWDWVLWKTVKGKAANYSTYTKCSARVTFPSRRPLNPAGEKWRVVAVHAGQLARREPVSAYRAFTVTPVRDSLPL